MPVGVYFVAGLVPVFLSFYLFFGTALVVPKAGIFRGAMEGGFVVAMVRYVHGGLANTAG